MDLSNESREALLICGSLTSVTKRFNEQTNIDQVNEYIRQEFDSNLPTSYRIVYYDITTMSMVNLGDQLQNGLTPFQLNSSIGVQSTTSTPNCIHLYIVSDTHSQTGKNNDLIKIYSILFLISEIQDDQIVSDIIDNEIHPELSKNFLIKYLKSSQTFI